MQELQLTKDTVEQLASKVLEVEKAFRASEKQVQYLEDEPAE